MMSLSRLWQRQGKKAEARQLLGEIYGWFTEGFDTADLQETKERVLPANQLDIPKFYTMHSLAHSRWAHSTGRCLPPTSLTPLPPI